MNSTISKITVLSLALTSGCMDAEKSKETAAQTNPIIGNWSASSVNGACYEMTWENGDSLEFCYEYPQFSFTTTELEDGTIKVSNIEGTIEFLTITTYAGQEPSTEADIMELIDLRLEVISEGAEYRIVGDIKEEDVITEDYLSLDCSLTESEELDCDLDEGVEEGEEEIFPDFSLKFIQS